MILGAELRKMWDRGWWEIYGTVFRYEDGVVPDIAARRFENVR
jgi:hypothetical protein